MMDFENPQGQMPPMDPFMQQDQPKKHDKHKGFDPSVLDSFRNETINLSTRLRILEERIINLRKKIQLTDTNLLQGQKRFNQEVKLFNTDISDLKHSIDSINTQLKLVIKELGNVARKEDVTMLSKYVEMWQPVAFVTRNELDRILDERIPKKKS